MDTLPFTPAKRIFRIRIGTVLWQSTSPTYTDTSECTGAQPSHPLPSRDQRPARWCSCVQHTPRPRLRAAEGRLHSRLRGASTASRPVHTQGTQHLRCRGIALATGQGWRRTQCPRMMNAHVSTSLAAARCRSMCPCGSRKVRMRRLKTNWR